MAPASAVYIARHGERIDHVDPSWLETAENVADPFLTDKGLAQAAALGQHLKEKNLSHIFVSPFYRTIQTANAVAEATGLSLKVEAGIAEYYNPDWFQVAPRLQTVDSLKQEFPAVDESYVSQVSPVFPESRDDAIVRSGFTARLLATRYSGNILLVAHGMTCEFTARGLTGNGLRPHIAYCSLQTLRCIDATSARYEIEGQLEPDVSFMPKTIRPVNKSKHS